MAVVGGLLLFIGLAGMVVGVWAFATGNLAWANIASRKVAAAVLAGGFVIAGVGSGLSGDDHDKVAVQAGSSDPTSTTASSEAATPSTEATTTTTTALTTSSSAPITTTTRVVTTTTRPASSTSTTRSTATTRPTTTTTVKPATTTTTKPGATTTTATPVAAGGQVSFGSMQCDAPGSDSASNVSEEWVEIVNTGGALSLSGWSVHDEGPNYTYSFRSGLTLPAGGRVRIHTGSGTDTANDLYWGRSQHVWNNTGDSAYLVNAGGVVAASRGC